MKEVDMAEARSLLAHGEVLGDQVPLGHDRDTHAMLAVEITGALLPRERIVDVPRMPTGSLIGVTVILTVGRTPEERETVGMTASLDDPDILILSAEGLTGLMTSLAENTANHLIKLVVGDPDDDD